MSLRTLGPCWWCSAGKRQRTRGWWFGHRCTRGVFSICYNLVLGACWWSCCFFSRNKLRGPNHAQGGRGGWCVPRVFCPSKIPSFLARWRVWGPAGTGSWWWGGASVRVPVEQKGRVATTPAPALSLSSTPQVRPGAPSKNLLKWCRLHKTKKHSVAVVTRAGMTTLLPRTTIRAVCSMSDSPEHRTR